jgi:hypothetical protein
MIGETRSACRVIESSGTGVTTVSEPRNGELRRIVSLRWTIPCWSLLFSPIYAAFPWGPSRSILSVFGPAVEADFNTFDSRRPASEFWSKINNLQAGKFGMRFARS